MLSSLKDGYVFEHATGLMHAVWEHGNVPERMRWEIIVILPEGDSGKVIEKSMVARLAIKFHDGVHRGLLGQGMGTATIKAKLAKSLVWCDQCPLNQIYVDLKKAYNALDRGRTLNILVAYVCV